MPYHSAWLSRLRRMRPALSSARAARLMPDGIDYINLHGKATRVVGPRLEGWRASLATLRGSAPFEPSPFRPPRVELLPPAERRRAWLATRLAITPGSEALT